MTREEAIQALNEIFDDSEFSRYEAWYGGAMDMAIEALKDQTKPIICPRCGRVFATEEGWEAESEDKE